MLHDPAQREEGGTRNASTVVVGAVNVVVRIKKLMQDDAATAVAATAADRENKGIFLPVILGSIVCLHTVSCLSTN